MNRFRGDLSKILDRINDRMRAVVQTTSRTLANEMMTGGRYSPGTPIDVGFHRSHWDAALGGMPAGGPAGSADPSEAELRVQSAIDEMDVGDVLFLTNNGPAIRRLEFEGWSQQAPDGFVRPAAEAIQSIVDEAVTHVVQGA